MDSHSSPTSLRSLMSLLAATLLLIAAVCSESKEGLKSRERGFEIASRSARSIDDKQLKDIKQTEADRRNVVITLSPQTSDYQVGIISDQVYKDCHAAWEQGSRENGVYRLSPNGFQEFYARCEFDAERGWTVMQKRYNGAIDFYLPWESYKRGFGDLQSEYWLGNDNIFELTRLNRKLSIYMMRWDGEEGISNYSNFYISNEFDNYRLTISGYSGSTGYDAMAYNNGAQFTTRDRDNDARDVGSCSGHWNGAWWYKNCCHSNLNGLFSNSSTGSIANMVLWSATSTWSGGHTRPLRRTTMRVSRE